MILLALLIGFSTLDFIFTNDFQKSSCRLTKIFQGNGQKSGFVYQISKLLSGVLTNWYFVFLALTYLFSSNLVVFYQYLILWSVPYSVVVTIRTLYARGRPLYLCGPNGEGLGSGDPSFAVQAWSCSCSFGMPSSHSCTAVAIFFALFMCFNRLRISCHMKKALPKSPTQDRNNRQSE